MTRHVCALLAILLLAGCATTDLCGVPYTDAEDVAGVEHYCPEPRP